MMKCLRSIAAAALAFGVTACAPHDESRAESTEAIPRRIVALTIGSVDTLARLGELDRIVAVEADCFVPGTEGLVKIRNDDHAGPPRALNVEAVLALNPDLVIAKEDLKPALSDRGVRVMWIPNASDLDSLAGTIGEIGARLHVPEKARALIDSMRAEATAIAQSVAGLPSVKVYYEAGRPGRTIGRDTVIDDMIALAGGVNIAGDQALANPSLSSEAIVAANPDVIVLSPWSDPPAEIMARPGWSSIAAVRDRRVFQIAERDRKVQYPSPSCVEGCAQLFVPWLHPQLAGAATREK